MPDSDNHCGRPTLYRPILPGNIARFPHVSNPFCILSYQSYLSIYALLWYHI